MQVSPYWRRHQLRGKKICKRSLSADPEPPAGSQTVNWNSTYYQNISVNNQEMKAKMKACVNFLQSREFGYGCLLIQEIRHYICQELLEMHGWRTNLQVTLTLSTAGQVPYFWVMVPSAIALTDLLRAPLQSSEHLFFSRCLKSHLCQPELQVICIS